MRLWPRAPWNDSTDWDAFLLCFYAFVLIPLAVVGAYHLVA